jgi:hypothetical protein
LPVSHAGWALFGLAALPLTWPYFHKPPDSAPTFRLSILPPGNSSFESFASRSELQAAGPARSDTIAVHWNLGRPQRTADGWFDRVANVPCWGLPQILKPPDYVGHCSCASRLILGDVWLHSRPHVPVVAVACVVRAAKEPIRDKPLLLSSAVEIDVLECCGAHSESVLVLPRVIGAYDLYLERRSNVRVTTCNAAGVFS